KHKNPQWDSIDALGRLNTWTYSLTNRLTAKTGAGPDEQPVRWELARLVLAQTFDDDAGRRPLGDLTGDLIVDPGRYVRLRADVRFQCWGLSFTYVNRARASVLSATGGPSSRADQEFRFTLNLLGVGPIGAQASVAQ